MMIFPEGGVAARIASWILTLLGLWILILFGLRVRKNLKDAGVTELDLNPIL